MESVTCDKCGEVVLSNEDVTWLEAIAKRDNSIMLYHARHINSVRHGHSISSMRISICMDMTIVKTTIRD